MSIFGSRSNVPSTGRVALHPAFVPGFILCYFNFIFDSYFYVCLSFITFYYLMSCSTVASFLQLQVRMAELATGTGPADKKIIKNPA